MFLVFLSFFFDSPFVLRRGFCEKKGRVRRRIRIRIRIRGIGRLTRVLRVGREEGEGRGG